MSIYREVMSYILLHHEYVQQDGIVLILYFIQVLALVFYQSYHFELGWYSSRMSNLDIMEFS